MLQDAQQTAFEAPAGVLAPGLALVVLVIGANLFADGLRDVADPTRRGRRAGGTAAPGLQTGTSGGDALGTAVPVASPVDPDGRPA